MSKEFDVIDGNEAIARVAYKTNEVIAIYPITPSSNMGEWSDAWAAEGIPNIWGTVPSVVEMQSEGGASGAIHGALQTGALSTTFTSSQGLLLMIPNMFKIAGELTAAVFHVAARTVATHALSIFGDHSDVMATRSTGFAQLSSASVQEAMDMALIAQAATLESRVPFLHFMDGFRTSHEVAKIHVISDDDMRAMISLDSVREHRARALSPDRPVLRGSAQNPDVFFQAREAINPFYLACADLTQKVMDRFHKLVGREYKLFQYHGAPDAERVLVLMGSGCETAVETADYLNAKGEKVGVLKVRLYRPFDVKRFLEALPRTTRSLAVLDRTKEPGSLGEPLYLDCVAALQEGIGKGFGHLAKFPAVIGGRYGLSSKEFTPAMIRSVYDELKKPEPKNHFTVGILDDVTHTSLAFDPSFTTEAPDTVRAVFFGLGSDGTVGANKNSIKIIGDQSDFHAQAYFVYDSKKSGATTVSHLRFGPRPIRSSYLIDQASFVACHQPAMLDQMDVLKPAQKGGIFLLNTAFPANEVWQHLPPVVAKQIVDKGLAFHVIDAYKVAREAGLGGRINTVMQVCFFALSKVIDEEKALKAIRKAIEKTYASKGKDVVEKNLKAVDATLANLHRVQVPATGPAVVKPIQRVPEEAPEFVRVVTERLMRGEGDDVPVSCMPKDGTFPTDTARWEKRNLAQEVPVWDEALCIQCGKCSMVCPHAAIRIKAYEPAALSKAPATFKSTDARDKDWKGLKYTIQVAPEDCTGCSICVDVCPAKSKAQPNHKALDLAPLLPIREPERANWDFFLSLPELDRRRIKVSQIKQQQVEQPLFEFSGACSGCGETPYLKLLTQLFGDRLLIANATGCSSIFGGNLPTAPWAQNAQGRGPAWSNSLFEDNAEFGMGFRVSLDKQRDFARELTGRLASQLGSELVEGLLSGPQNDEAGIYEQRERVEVLKQKLPGIQSPEARQLSSIADLLVKKSVWIVGGDGWAYDIGFGGLDHVLASGRNVNVLVLDTEVYSNTGGQMSKSTPRGAVAKFAAGGKPLPKKDLSLIAMAYGNIYVARVAFGAKDEHTLKAFLEAEAYEGPSIIIAYSHCIAHGIDMASALAHQKAVVDSGQWPLFRYNPERAKTGQNPMQLDSKAPSIPVEQFMYMENRFKALKAAKPEVAKKLLEEAQGDVNYRRRLYEYLANQPWEAPTAPGQGPAAK
ncbi:MAG: pyruvate:ferredoxin (flavodoxin) oxidoreductase [Candidatus Riflebacteria bacterium]|nr:pyruvate:ferredoxin (flavodoxin) oxidoreductase [Candidatus Riflebacteria bacterium]